VYSTLYSAIVQESLNKIKQLKQGLYYSTLYSAIVQESLNKIEQPKQSV
jgi:hypothetical protein